MGFNSGFKGLIVYREVIALSSKIRTKHANKFCEQNAEFFNVKHICIYTE